VTAKPKLHLNEMQKLIRQKEAGLVDELSRAGDVKFEEAKNWFRSRWDCDYAEFVKKEERQKA